jgi:hypothetical protein
MCTVHINSHIWGSVLLDALPARCGQVMASGHIYGCKGCISRVFANL